MLVKAIFMGFGKVPALAAFLGSVLVAFLALAEIETAPASAASWGEGYLPNVAVFDQDSKELKFYDDVIKGRIVVVSFIYTSCRDMCPLITARLVLMRGLLDPDVAKKITFVSISIDPQTDTPLRLKEYADAMGAVGPGWIFITGQKKDIDAIRHKLGERSNKFSDHRNEILLGNDATGEWEKGSALGDLGVLAASVRAMDPDFRNEVHVVTAALPGSFSKPLEEPAGQGLFIKACAPCHSIGEGIRVGPDLAGLTVRRERPWLLKYITIPNRMRALKDPVALKLGMTFKRVRMPNLGIAETEANELIQYIESRSPAE